VSHVFISHVEEDAEAALELALGLEQQGFGTWCYELDSVPGPSYLLRTGQAIERSGAVVLVISPHSLGSSQMTREVVRAHESGKPFVPVLHDITHAEFQARQPEWREAIGAATSIRVPVGGVAGILQRIADGLGDLGICPTKRGDPARVAAVRRALTELHASEKARLAVSEVAKPPGPPTVTPGTSAGGPPPTAAGATAIITPSEGMVSEVPLASLHLAHWSMGSDVLCEKLHLRGGLRVPFDKIRGFEVVTGSDKLTLTIFFLDGKIETFIADSYTSSSYLVGQTDVGDIRLPLAQVKRLEFQR
jgi:hypothetical protein